MKELNELKNITVAQWIFIAILYTGAHAGFLIPENSEHYWGFRVIIGSVLVVGDIMLAFLLLVFMFNILGKKS